MIADILASGSSGNCTAIKNGKSLILIDCGKSVNWTLNQLKGRLPDAILITHEHCDHAKSAQHFLKRGVDIFMTKGTADALKLNQYNLHIIKVGLTFQTCGINITPINSVHDAAEPINFILQHDSERWLYVTDTAIAPDVDGYFDKIFIEANYSPFMLFPVDINENHRQRIVNNHLSIYQTALFLCNFPTAEVHLLHVSNRHGNIDFFNSFMEAK